MATQDPTPPRPVAAPDRRGDFLAAGTLAAIVLSAYMMTLAPGLLMNDSGEFQTLVATLGHTHPTGYPVYLLLAKLVTWLPVKDVAYRVNLVSALAGVVVAVELFFLARLLTGRRWLSWVVALALAASPTFWSQAVLAEVYVPAAAFQLGVLWLLALWQNQGRSFWVFLAGLLGGLSVGVHLSVALSAPAAVLIVALRREEHKRNIAAATCGALAGTLLTLSAFAAIDRNRPPSDYFRAVVEPSRSEWGLSTEDIGRFRTRLVFSLTARQYQDNLRQPSWADVRDQATDYVQNLPQELPPLVLIAAAVGIVRFFRDNWRYGLLLLLSLATHLAYTFTHDMGDIHVAYIPTYIVLAVCATGALGVRSGASHPRRGASLPERIIAVLLLAAVLLPNFRDEAWTPEGRRAGWIPEGEPPFRVGYSSKLKHELTALVNALEDDAVLLTEWHLLYPCYYVAHVEQGRTGITFIQTYPAIGQRELATSAREFLRQKLHERQVYVLEPLPELRDETAFAPVRRGGWMLYRVRERPDGPQSGAADQ